MITFFATARPFSGHMGLIQRNAIRSWLALSPPCEILLLGDDEGTASIAREFGLRHLPYIGCNEFGTPLISSLFRCAQEEARYELVCQINADIILTDDFLPAIERVRSRKDRFLLTGQRWDVDMDEPWDFAESRWTDQLKDYVKKHGSLHPPTGLDYFVFVKGTLGVIPPFAIGRRVLDNWLIFRARQLGLPVVDATAAITAIHQNHGYAFHPQGAYGVMEGLEVRENLELAGGSDHMFTLEDATHVLTPSGMKFVFTRERLRRHLNTLAILCPRLAPVMKLTGRLLKMARSLWPAPFTSGR